MFIKKHLWTALILNCHSPLVVICSFHNSDERVFALPFSAATARDVGAAGIQTNLIDPIFIGPDSESQQGVSEVTRESKALYVALEKIHRGDRGLVVNVPDPSKLHSRRLVRVNDIISTARAMIMAIQHLTRQQTPPPACVRVYGIFTGGAHSAMLNAGARHLFTTNTIPHMSDAIDRSDTIGDVQTVLLRGSKVAKNIGKLCANYAF